MINRPSSHNDPQASKLGSFPTHYAQLRYARTLACCACLFVSRFTLFQGNEQRAVNILKARHRPDSAGDADVGGEDPLLVTRERQAAHIHVGALRVNHLGDRPAAERRRRVRALPAAASLRGAAHLRRARICSAQFFDDSPDKASRSAQTPVDLLCTRVTQQQKRSMLTVVSINACHYTNAISKGFRALVRGHSGSPAADAPGCTRPYQQGVQSTELQKLGSPAAGGARPRPARARARRWTPCGWTTSPPGCSPSARSTPVSAHALRAPAARSEDGHMLQNASPST